MTKPSSSLKQLGYNMPIKVSHVLREQHSKVKKTCGLLDTGASITVVSFSIIEYLKLESNINKEHSFNVPFINNIKGANCPLKFTFMHNNQPIDINISALCFPKKDLTLGECEVLIGRDILKYFDFNWEGTADRVTINCIQKP